MATVFWIGALIAQAVQRMAQQERIPRLALVDDMTGLENRIARWRKT